MEKMIMLVVVLVLMIGAPMTAFASKADTDNKSISEGVIVITRNVPKEGINLVYNYKDLAPATGGGSMYANLTKADDGEFQWLGFTFDTDGSPYKSGDKFTVSVSKYVPNGVNSNGIPQPILDKKTVTLGETGAIVTLDLRAGRS